MNSTNPSRYFSDNWPDVKSDFIHAYDFEVFDIPKSRNFMIEYRPWAVGICTLYVVLIFYGQAWMRARPAFNLKSTLTLWNSFLALFSIFGFLRAVPEVYYLLSQSNGLYLGICTHEHHNYALAFWILMFAWSKIVELGDTAFIVLRKQRLIFLHWYHHISTLLFTWVLYEEYDSSGKLFVVMNLLVHSFMYSYYALKSLKIAIPRKLAMSITTMQIAQMIAGFAINIYSQYKLEKGVPCGRTPNSVRMGLGLYGSFFVLFANFFVRTYFMQKKSKTN
ncbi:unnamed protein product [Allacma fusca]|uniref:Elongation of very long chain fatty acids protein n=1 Tax=Allacma fusca TaxID=39272 RepID=A0A8J2PDI2_9HEXA|nr:unnamed protein product [Allacma fusca]